MADTSKPDAEITDSKTLNSYHKGHRERMRAKVSADSTSILSDAEVLEMFLYGINSRADTKPVVKALLAKFKNISNIITADKAELRSVKGVGSAAIIHFHLIREIEQRMKRDLIKDKPILANWQAVQDFCISQLDFEKVEHLLVLLLDAQNRLIESKIMTSGTINQTAIYPREIAKLGLNFHAKNIILAHNHPTFDDRPSQADILLTRKVKQALLSVDIELHDHLIIAGNKCQSFKSIGLL